MRVFMSIIDKYICVHTFIYTHYWLVPSSIAYCALSTASPLAVAFWQATAYCLLPVAYCLLHIAYWQAIAYCPLAIGMILSKT